MALFLLAQALAADLTDAQCCEAFQVSIVTASQRHRNADSEAGEHEVGRLRECLEGTARAMADLGDSRESCSETPTLTTHLDACA